MFGLPDRSMGEGLGDVGLVVVDVFTGRAAFVVQAARSTHATATDLNTRVDVKGRLTPAR
jgi:tRNA G37 N-methylase Trm5